MAGAKNTDKKVVKSTVNVHVVVFSCPDCTHEEEFVKICPECGKPMRVINVVEKFGDEAEEYIKKFKGEEDLEIDEGKEEEFIDVDAPTIIKLSEEDHISDDEEENTDSLGVIYPDDDQTNTSSEGVDMDFMEALEQLDEEEEDPGEFNDLPEL
jgi:hypothetical protein